MQNNITHTLHNHLCLGCGLCEDICPKHCITIQRKDGEHRPVLDTSLCLGDKCGRCLKVCPGVGINLSETSRLLYENGRQDKYIGRYVSLYTGYSLDEDIRYHSASGGMVSQFLIYLLDKKIIDGAVVTGFSEEDHLTPVSYIARTKEDVIKARSSKYCPVALNKVGNEIAGVEGKYVIVGLPCHIQGFRKRAKIDRKFREKVIGYFAIYCSSNRTFHAQDYLLRKYHVRRDSISYFAYRDNGCLGSMCIRQQEGRGQEFPPSTATTVLCAVFSSPGDASPALTTTASWLMSASVTSTSSPIRMTRRASAHGLCETRISILCSNRQKKRDISRWKGWMRIR